MASKTKKKMSDPDIAVAKFPLANYMSLMAIMLMNCMIISYIFPFIGYFIVHIGAAENTVTAGYSAGIVVSMYFLGRGLANFGWGLLADMYGRKAVLLVSLICSTVSAVGFGFSTTLFQMCAWRFVGGVLNGVNTTTKVLSYEMASTNEHRNRGAAWLQASWGVGLILGPGIAGFLSEPCSQDSDLFGMLNPDHLLCIYPFALPGFAVAVLHIVSFIAWFILPETSQSPRGIRLNCMRRCSPYSTLPLSPENKNKKTTKVKFTKVAQDLQPEAITVGKDENLDLENQNKAPSSVVDASGELSNSAEGETVGSIPADSEERYKLMASTTLPSVDSNDAPTEKTAPQALKSHSPWWRQRKFLVFTFVQAIAITALVMAQELASLWAILPVARGGPQWSEQTIGKSWIPLGVFLIVVQLLLVPKLVTRIGLETSLRWGLCGNTIAVCLLPWVALANPLEAPELNSTVEPTVYTMGLYLLIIALQQFINQFVCIPLMTLISSSVDATDRARAVGLSTSVQSLCMSLSPILAGSILSVTVDYTGAKSANPIASFPGGTHSAFLVSSLMLLSTLVLLTKSLPKEGTDQRN